IPLVIGGAGFIGTNVARRLLEGGHPVLVLDSLARPGSEGNLRAMRAEYGELVEVQIGDVRDRTALRRAVARASAVFHFAAQVAVTTSLNDPVHDFEVNLRGTLNLLEELRGAGRPIPLVFTSTNKVYGGMHTLPVRELPTRYQPEDAWLAGSGIDEAWPLELASPYGCSKGGADQYVLEYARTFGMPAVVARMSCIYGPHQLGNEDQGWVAHFLIRAIERRPITIYGDGKQVRDVLHVEDLVDAFFLLMDRMPEVSGHAFNVGGGPANAVSLRELLELISAIRSEPVTIAHAGWRASDQRYYVSCTRKLEAATGWRPRIPVADGVRALHDWLAERRRVDSAPLMAQPPLVGAVGEVG
ncbi:MAG TPA: NAD-dependent epimerase/dehydratase family protein, partial [Kofleriaceae bacterium]|nr:NAD-dependent epimerase/dehydratase family protein [Kofleriaceae bacterium]